MSLYINQLLVFYFLYCCSHSAHMLNLKVLLCVPMYMCVVLVQLCKFKQLGDFVTDFLISFNVFVNNSTVLKTKG